MTSLRAGLKSVLPEAALRAVRFHRHSIRARRIYGGASAARAIVGHLQTRVRPHRTILFYPDAPWFPHVVFKQCAVSGHRMTTDPRVPHDVAFKWKGATYFEVELLKAVPADAACIVNARSTDISKSRVARVFHEVFGYPLEVDPTSFSGLMVEKSEMNAHHDGRVVQGPLSADSLKPGAVYQRLIDTVTDDGEHVIDLRIPFYGGSPPLVYVKRRAIAKRFTTWNRSVEMRAPGSVFSQEELGRLVAFVAAMGIDYGELDILRDRDGRIYVVDANNTPAGPPNGLTPQQCVEATATLCAAFEAFVEEWMTRSPEPRPIS